MLTAERRYNNGFRHSGKQKSCIKIAFDTAYKVSL